MHKELGKLSDQVTAGEVCFRFGATQLSSFSPSVGEYSLNTGQCLDVHIRGLSNRQWNLLTWRFILERTSESGGKTAGGDGYSEPVRYGIEGA
jgi:hypothetical protein